MTIDLRELRPEAIVAAQARADEQLAAGQPDEAVALMRSIVERALSTAGDESELAGLAQMRLAALLRRTGAPEAEQLGCLTDAIKAFSASLGPSDAQTTAAFAQLATTAFDAGAIEVAVTAGMQALGGLEMRGEGETPQAGGIYATLAIAAAARRSPAAPGAAERAHQLTAGAASSDADRRRALTAWRSLGSPQRHAVNDELSVVSFGAPPALVIELHRIAEDGAADQHNHGLRAEAARAFRAKIAAAPFAWRASSGGFEAVSRSGGGAALRFVPESGAAGETVEAPLDAAGLERLRTAVSAALSGSGTEPEPGRNDPCPCGSGAKYKRCCGR